MHIEGIKNTMADAISGLDFSPKAFLSFKKERQNWMSLTKCWCAFLNTHNESISKNVMDLNQAFTNCRSKEEIYPLTVSEIAEKQIKEKALQQQRMMSKYEAILIENTCVLCKNGKLVVPKTLQHKAVAWYHHYLCHPGNTRLEESFRAAVYWKNMQKDVQYYVNNCKSCQVNKRKKLKYRKFPSQLVIDTPWEYLCVDLIGPYTLRAGISQK